MSRWKPTRAGIFNIWEYDDQVFEFGDGRLVLRGRNGSGKSNALSLIFPFVLDGVMSATRMDPMGGGRSMKSLLLGRDDDDAGGRYRYESGSGYVWMEFARTTAEGGAEHLTIGVGAHATQQRDAKAWFFITPLRVGHELALADDDERPKGQRQLTETLDGAGEVYATAEDYRVAVDRVLFGLGNVRWRTMLDLLLTLRRPHLAGKLDTDHLSFTLSAGLAELDPALIADVAHSFDDLDAMHDELEGVTGALDAVERFLPAYRRHLLGVARQRAGHLVAISRDQRTVAAELRTSEHERDDAGTEVTRTTELVAENRRTRERVDTEIEAIQSSQAFRDAAALSEVEQRAAGSRRAADATAEALGAARVQRDSAVAAETAATVKVQRAAGELDRDFAAWRDLAQSVGLRDTASTPDGFDSDGTVASITSRTNDVAQIDELARSSAAATAEAQRASAARRRVEDHHDDAITRRGHAEVELQRVAGELETGLDEWASRLEPVAARVRTASGRTIPDMATTWTGTDIDDPRLPATIGAALAETRTALVVTAERHEAAAADRRDSIDRLLAERRRIEDEPNPGPPTKATRPDADRPDRAGAPLYMCVDFADSIADDDRAGIEAALDAAGLLDARIEPPRDDGEAPDPDAALDARIVMPDGTANTPTHAATLADLLVPIAVGDLTAAHIAAVLRTVALDTGYIHVGRDGSWRLGPLAGRYRKPHADFIGHEAREQRRAVQLAELDAVILGERSALADIEGALLTLSQLAAELDEIAAERPSFDPLMAAHRSLVQAQARTDQLAEQLATAVNDAEIADESAVAASTELHRRGDLLVVPVDDVARRELASAITDARRLGDRVARSIERLADRHESLLAATESVGAAHGFLADTERRADDARTGADADQVRYETLLARVGDDVETAVRALADAKERLVAARRASGSLSEQLRDAEAAVARLTERCTHLGERLEQLAVAVADAGAAMVAVCSAEVAEVLDVEGVAPGADPLAAANATLADPTDVPDDATNRMEREHRAVLLDGLRAGHDPSMPKLDGFDVVRVGTADGEIPIGTLARRLRADRDRLGLLLSDREREIFETHLLARVGDALRELLFEADHFEQRINAEMAKAPTSSGMTVELVWRVESDDPTVKQAVKTLRYSPDTMGPEQREVLRAFFTDQIQARRSADPGRSFVDVLTAALDYRTWHAFSFHIRSASGGRSQVTRKYFRELSGGEAATVLHLPLFAAAAAHYASGSVDGPRLIALDEAFAGIDDDMRGKLMGLLVQLDLDVLLTSHEFWGFYGQVPNLVLYDLTRRPPQLGVFAQRLEWSSSEDTS